MYKSLSSTTTNKLKHQPSKLDLIDDTTLTSLPLPPPPPLRRHLSRSRSPTSSSQGSKLSHSSSINNSTRINSNNSNNNNCQTKNLDANYSYEDIDVDDIDDSCDNDNDEEVEEEMMQEDYIGGDDYDYEYEYTFDEDSQDPIVLIEDYFQPQNIKFANNTTTTISNNNNNNNTLLDQQKLLRQQSLANFKQSLLLIHNHQNTLNNINPLNDDSNLILKINRKEDLQAIFGEIPGSKLLKYCEFCEKPLYEISSIINNHNNNNNNNSHNQKHQQQPQYQQQCHYEFICGDCIENYDQYYNLEFANVIIGGSSGGGNNCGNEIEIENKNTNKLWKIFHSISYKYKIIE